MKYSKVLLLILSLIFSLYATGQEKTKVLLLGTYHFGATSDKNKGSDDVLNPKKQAELNLLLKKLKAYNPEKIYVENQPSRQRHWDSIFVAYQVDKALKIKNEIFQIGIKLAENLKFKTGVTCVDWQQDSENSFNEKAYVEYRNKINLYQNFLETKKPSVFSEHDKLIGIKIQKINIEIPKMTMVDAFKKINSKSYLNDIFYGNITAFLDIDSNQNGVFYAHDNMIRNTNIYKNIIQDILKNNPKKALVLYGAGHIRALKDYLECHPSIEIIEVDQYLN
ncbi:DUF5694 domain-containing protein [Flavobacterium sp. RSP15]|uniref:DUF5694 domain-containing protein n=1 Tax=Flavobacterium sp. RSP15 TaxID=2497485 RepID=UPI000F81F4B9|nr:DUF5694 domain-containing protein [Flavobacterium sp. RSP15]RTY87060.1 hypothetical protein EKM00_07120 [Flavobacterium sp. RSP15]